MTNGDTSRPNPDGGVIAAVHVLAPANMKDALANWRWLVPLPHRETAVVLAPPSIAPADHIAEGFARVEFFDLTAHAGDGERFIAAWESRHAPGSLDCVAVPHVTRRLNGWPSPARVLAAVRRSLRPGTGTYVAVEEFRSPATGGRLGGLRGSLQASLLQATGFHEIRRYIVVHTPARPRHLIPEDARALGAWLDSFGDPGARGRVDRGLVRLGLHPLIFRTRLVLARA